MIVVLVGDDIDRHGGDCLCGSCDADGKSYGVAIFKASTHAYGGADDPLDRVYAPSEASAFVSARVLCESNGWIEE